MRFRDYSADNPHSISAMNSIARIVGSGTL
jgi:hypothetical protein